MTSGGDNFNYFPANQLAKFYALQTVNVMLFCHEWWKYPTSQGELSLRGDLKDNSLLLLLYNVHPLLCGKILWEKVCIISKRFYGIYV